MVRELIYLSLQHADLPPPGHAVTSYRMGDLPLLTLFQGCLQLKRILQGSFQAQGRPAHSEQRSFGDTSIGWGGRVLALSRVP